MLEKKLKIKKSKGISDKKIIFCDSLEALDSFFLKEDLSEFEIMTSSPAVMLHNDYDAISFESKWSVNELRKFQSSINVRTKEIYDVLIDKNFLSRGEVLTSALVFYYFHKVIYKAACIDDSFFNKDITYIKVFGPNFYEKNNTQWDLILRGSKKIKVINHNLAFQNNIQTRSNNLIARIKLAGIKFLFLKTYLKISNYFPSFRSKRIYINGENELLLETLEEFAKGFFKISKIEFQVKNHNSKKNSKNFSILKNTLRPLLEKTLGEYTDERIMKNCSDIFFNFLEEQLSLFHGYISYLEKSIDSHSVILSNALGNIKGAALSDYCEQKNIPLISFQHGVTAEINGLINNERHIAYESTMADIAFLFNKSMGHTETKSPYCRAYLYDVGASKRHLSMSKNTNKQSNKNNFIYISTNLYKGNIGLFGSLYSDYDRALTEIDIVKNVLSKQSHNITYKTYPVETIRFPDIDPVIKELEKHQNISVINNKIDMRYLISQFEIFITTCATSTLTWPIMSGKPVIFINKRFDAPLSEEAEKDFSKGIFVFNYEDPNFSKQLTNFLSQSVDEIILQWQDKQNYRNNLIQKYFSSSASKSGRRAFRILKEKMIF